MSIPNHNNIRPPGVSAGEPSPSENEGQRIEKGPQINSINDLHAYGEALTTKDGKLEPKYTFACFIDRDDVAYFGRTSVSRLNLTPQVLRNCLKRIADGDIYPKEPADITVFSSPITEVLYVKRPDLKSWDDFEETDFLSRLFLGEVEAFELLHQNPHSNIVRYHGCRVNRGRITGIVLDRCSITLEQRLEDEPHDLNGESCLKGIEAGVEHLHSLGLAHNDLNPANIMLDKHDRPIIIDFGSCKPIGTRLMEAGTTGWIEEHSHTSDLRHDDIAMQKIRVWMEEKMLSQGISV